MQTGSEVRKVVINSSPVISLSIIGKMELLRELFQEVYIPRAVYNEIVNKGEKQTGRRELQNADWIQIKDVRNINLKESIKIELDEGEAEVITLAKENDIQTVIIDEFAGRQYAVLMGLNVIGTLGILLYLCGFLLCLFFCFSAHPLDQNLIICYFCKSLREKVCHSTNLLKTF